MIKQFVQSFHCEFFSQSARINIFAVKRTCDIAFRRPCSRIVRTRRVCDLRQLFFVDFRYCISFCRGATSSNIGKASGTRTFLPRAGEAYHDDNKFRARFRLRGWLFSHCNEWIWSEWSAIFVVNRYQLEIGCVFAFCSVRQLESWIIKTLSCFCLHLELNGSELTTTINLVYPEWLAFSWTA